MKPALRYCLYSQALLVVTIMICTLIAPQYLLSNNEGGISNYAIHFTTAVVFTLGFIGGSSLLYVATNFLARYKQAAHLIIWLRLVTAGYLIVLASTYPYKYSLMFQHIHLYVSVSFALLLLATTVRFAGYNHNDAPAMLALAVILTGFGLGTATNVGIVHLLFLSQLLVGVGFGGALVHTVNLLTASAKYPEKAALGRQPLGQYPET